MLTGLSRRSVLAGVVAVPFAVPFADAGGAPEMPAAPPPPGGAGGGSSGLARDVPGLRPRADWRAAPALPGGRIHVPVRLALHHTAGPQVGSDRAPATLRGIQTFHMRDKGWIDLAYHVFVDADGAAWEGRAPGLAGDTATAYDPAGFLLVCALGNFETVAPTAAQEEGIARVLAALSRARGLALDDLALHRDLAATLCPGKNLAARVPTIVARARILAANAP